ncbi:MAG: Holliday junction branch migration protein RuvA [Clostridiaceae bacterium]|jgi:Holliday junction DNA helicase RuvA|nr:Holliday junction branch migration protein RuvA [Clostridiaceae bacterium]
MYAYIKGKLEARGTDYLVIETGGVGYLVYTTLTTLQEAGRLELGQEFRVYTHLHVREDVMDLFGFATHEELSVFKLLLTVSGVGPKVALSLLSAVSPSKFSLAIITDDVKTLTKAQGVGNKMAQRIILELKDKIKKEQLAFRADTGPLLPQEPQAGSGLSEAVSALMVLGYTQAEANRAVAAVYSDGMELEEIIRNALKGLMK